MEQLIFFAVIIIFSIIESVARSRKRRSGGGRVELPPDWETEEAPLEWRPESRSRDAAPTTYDADPSYVELEVEEARRSRGARPGAGSEGMIPADIWEEIAGLARGPASRPEPMPVPPPLPAPRPATTPAREGWGRRAPRVGQTHRVHEAHASYGTDPSSRAPSQQDGLDPLAHSLSQDVSSVRRQLRRHGRSALRQAMILQEVLGPPASTRDGPPSE